MVHQIFMNEEWAERQRYLRREEEKAWENAEWERQMEELYRPKNEEKWVAEEPPPHKDDF